VSAAGNTAIFRRQIDMTALAFFLLFRTSWFIELAGSRRQ
jgi:hypothetical protein